MNSRWLFLILTRSKLGVIYYYTSTRNATDRVHVHTFVKPQHAFQLQRLHRNENSALRDASFPLKIRSTNGQKGI